MAVINPRPNPQYCIPSELQALPQWVTVKVLWDDAKQKWNKIPLNARTGSAASVTEPKTWSTFKDAISCGMPIGFVLTKNDPYCIVDLDTYEKPHLMDHHAELISKAETYTETSYSGNGSHIVVKATLDSGHRHDPIGAEVYPNGRFILMTGKVKNNYPINDGQELVDWLVSNIKNSRRQFKEVGLPSTPSPISDLKVYARARDAENGDKFIALWEGRWHDYPEHQNDHSRADLALLTFIDFYTKDVDQAIRLFKNSKLFRGNKKGRKTGDGTDYVIRTLTAARKRNENDHPPPVDFSKLKLRTEAIVEAQVEEEVAVVANAPLIFPQGLVGDIAQYIFTASIRPVAEVSLAGALTLMAGICGRQFQIPGSGLNLYIILLGETGIGKECAKSGINKLIAQVRKTVPSVDQFKGPSYIASGQAINKAMAKKTCVFCLLPEFAFTMQGWANAAPGSAGATLQQSILDLYSKSGKNDVLDESIYSDSDKNSHSAYAPAMSILGDATPGRFYNQLSEDQIESGLITRFIFIEYKGKRVPENEVSAFQDPSPQLVDRLADVVATVVQMEANNTFQLIARDPAASALLKTFNKRADFAINSSNEVGKQLWNRAHLKVLRIAGLIAVGCNIHNPIIDAQNAQWAIDFIEKDILQITSRFDKGQVGDGEYRFEAEIRTVILSYLSMPAEKKLSYKTPKILVQEKGLIPYSFLRRRLRPLTMFKNDKRGPARAIQEAMKDLCEAGILKAVPRHQVKEKYGLDASLYALGEAW